MNIKNITFVTFLFFSTFLHCACLEGITQSSQEAKKNTNIVFPGVGYYFCEQLTFDENFFQCNQNKLFIVAFNVSQGNCIILRKGNNVVIVDSGKGNGYKDQLIFSKIEGALQGATIKAIVLTHAHDDHLNLLTDLLIKQRKNKYSFDTNTKLILGGYNKSWENKLKIKLYEPLIEHVQDLLGYSTVNASSADKLIKKLEELKTALTANVSTLKIKEFEDLKGKKVENAQDWVDKIISFINSFKENREYYTAPNEKSNDFNNHLKDCISDVKFKFILPPYSFSLPKPKKSEKENEQSIVLRVEYKDKNILFTGDATSITLDNIIGHDYNGDVKCYNHLKGSIGIDETVLNKEFDKKDTLIGRTNIDEVKNFSEISKQNREDLKNIHLLVLPHHGSESNGSGRWLNYINGSSHNTLSCLLISSLPVSKDFLPYRFIDEGHFTGTPVDEHLISYQRQFISPEDHKKRVQDPPKRRFYKFTNKPVYTTGTAPGGFYCFVIDEGSLKLFAPNNINLKSVVEDTKDTQWQELSPPVVR